MFGFRTRLPSFCAFPHVACVGWNAAIVGYPPGDGTEQCSVSQRPPAAETPAATKRRLRQPKLPLRSCSGRRSPPDSAAARLQLPAAAPVAEPAPAAAAAAPPGESPSNAPAAEPAPHAGGRPTPEEPRAARERKRASERATSPPAVTIRAYNPETSYTMLAHPDIAKRIGLTDEQRAQVSAMLSRTVCGASSRRRAMPRPSRR